MAMNEKKKQYKQVVTPMGKALFPHLDKPEMYEGKDVGFTITVKFNEKDTKNLIDIIDSELEKAKSEITLKAGQKWSAEPFLGYKEDKNGDIVFKFKTSDVIKLKDGTILNRKVPVFDAHNNKIETPTFGNGSDVKVAFQLVPFWVSKAVNGVSLRLVAVQLINKVEFGNHTADEYGFTVEEDGYDSTEDVPFKDDDEESDF